MEVHHLPKLHHGGKKKFKEYAIEFFLLFFAVFLGFIAENIRENIGEHKRAKQYIRSLLKDLETDTTALNGSIKRNIFNKNNYDSLLALLKDPSSLKKPDLLYYYFIPTTYYNPFAPTERTIQQLESSGQMRLLENMDVSDSITSYYEMVKGALVQHATFMRYFDIYHEQAFKIFSYSQVDTLFFKRKDLLNLKVNLKLITTDPAQIEILFSKLYVISKVTGLYIDDLKKVKDKATAAIGLIKKEYRVNE
jgi:hypothetical protein